MSQRRLSRKGVLLGFDRIFDEEGGLAILSWESRFEGGGRRIGRSRSVSCVWIKRVEEEWVLGRNQKDN